MQVEVLHSTLNFGLKSTHYSPLTKVLNNCSLCLFSSYLAREDEDVNQFILTLPFIIIFRICKIKIDSPDGNGDATISLDLIFLETRLQEKIVISLA